MNTNNVIKLSTGGSSHVRMSPAEYKRIQKDSKASGKSIPELLRESYFHNPPLKVLMSKDEVATLRKDLSRIGNNLNQVARHLNSGLFHGWNNTLDMILEQFKTLTSQVHYGYGVPKN